MSKASAYSKAQESCCCHSHVGIPVHESDLVDVHAEGKQAVRLWVKAGHLLELRRSEQRAVGVVFPAVIHAGEDTALPLGLGHIGGVLGRGVDDGESSVATDVVEGALRGSRAALAQGTSALCASLIVPGERKSACTYDFTVRRPDDEERLPGNVHQLVLARLVEKALVAAKEPHPRENGALLEAENGIGSVEARGHGGMLDAAISSSAAAEERSQVGEHSGSLSFQKERKGKRKKIDQEAAACLQRGEPSSPA